TACRVAGIRHLGFRRPHQAGGTAMRRGRIADEQRFARYQRKHGTWQLRVERPTKFYLRRPVMHEQNRVYRTICTHSFWAHRDTYQGDMLGQVNADANNAIVHGLPSNSSITNWKPSLRSGTN